MTRDSYPYDEFDHPRNSDYKNETGREYGPTAYTGEQGSYKDSFRREGNYGAEGYSEASYGVEDYQQANGQDNYRDRETGADEEKEAYSESVREGDLLNIIDRLEDTILNARSLPFSSNAAVPREEALLLIGLLRDNIPEEIHRANWLLTQNRQVIEEARNMADSIVRQAERREATMINEHEITLRAGEMAAQTLDQAKHAASEIRNGALDYAERRLSILEEQLTAMLVTIQKNRKELH